MGAMYKVCSLRLCLKLRVWPTTENKFYLCLTVGKMHAFAVFTGKYLRPYDCSETNFTLRLKCTNLKTKIENEIIEIEIIKI